MKNTDGKLEHKLLHRIQKKCKRLHNCTNYAFMKAQLAAFMKQIWTACN